MNRTTENLLVWGTLGAGVALILSNHRRWGVMVAAIAPITAISQHPRASWKVLKGVPRGVSEGMKAAGKAAGKAGQGVGRSMAEVGKSIKWMAS